MPNSPTSITSETKVLCAGQWAWCEASDLCRAMSMFLTSSRGLLFNPRQGTKVPPQEARISCIRRISGRAMASSKSPNASNMSFCRQPWAGAPPSGVGRKLPIPPCLGKRSAFFALLLCLLPSKHCPEQNRATILGQNWGCALSRSECLTMWRSSSTTAVQCTTAVWRLSGTACAWIAGHAQLSTAQTRNRNLITHVYA